MTPAAGRMRRRRSHSPVLTRSVAPGVHRLEHAFVNCYLLEEGTSLTLVDTGLPATHRHLLAAIDAIGHRIEDVEAVVLTHAHFDHIGAARRIQEDMRVPIHLNGADGYIARHPYHYAHERARSLYPLLHPRAVPVLAAMTGAGALGVHGISGTRSIEGGDELDVPGRPIVVETPGHTYGHCALHLPSADALISGDALVTLDPYTGGTGPRIVAGAATADSELALSSLHRLERTEASTVLPGHGDPYRGGIRSAVAEALRTGPS